MLVPPDELLKRLLVLPLRPPHQFAVVGSLDRRNMAIPAPRSKHWKSSPWLSRYLFINFFMTVTHRRNCRTYPSASPPTISPGAASERKRAFSISFDAC